MRVEESQLDLAASHSLATQRRIEAESKFSFTSALRDADAALPTAEAAAASGAENQRDEAVRIRLLLQQLVDAILAALSGEKCRCRADDIADLKQGLPVAGDGGATRASFTWERRQTEYIEEHETTAVSANGRVRTADGREIKFALDLSMCRDFSCTRETVESGRIEFKDPLVINFDGKAAELVDTRFSFDLDADGSAESLPMLARGSGFLVFDENRDGRIADGRELFGAAGKYAGDGFADLASHDSDHNGWIDEADPAYAALGVWFPDGRITPLKESGVGAIGLTSAWSPFSLKDADNRPLGQIWQTGVYLAEDGKVGSVQQVDLATEKAPALDSRSA